jgi:hypothetical protein
VTFPGISFLNATRVISLEGESEWFRDKADHNEWGLVSLQWEFLLTSPLPPLSQA